jgi:hypothetical protein
VKFNAEIYSNAGIQAAASTFADFGTINVPGDAMDGYYDVNIVAADDVDQRDLEGEFGNFAFARSFDERTI